MFFLRRGFFTLLLSAATLSATLSSCGEKEEQAQPTRTSSQQLATGSWLLEHMAEDRQTAISGDDIKDRFALRFNSNGTYAKQMLADGTVFKGSWAVKENGAIIHLTDHKGTDHHYILGPIKTNSFRYSFVNQDDRLVTYIFSARP